MTMAPLDFEDPIERDRRRAAPIGFWIAFITFAILGSVWFLFFRL